MMKSILLVSCMMITLNCITKFDFVQNIVKNNAVDILQEGLINQFESQSYQMSNYNSGQTAVSYIACKDYSFCTARQNCGMSNVCTGSCWDWGCWCYRSCSCSWQYNSGGCDNGQYQYYQVQHVSNSINQNDNKYYETTFKPIMTNSGNQYTFTFQFNFQNQLYLYKWFSSYSIYNSYSNTITATVKVNYNLNSNGSFDFSSIQVTATPQNNVDYSYVVDLNPGWVNGQIQTGLEYVVKNFIGFNSYSLGNTFLEQKIKKIIQNFNVNQNFSDK